MMTDNSPATGCIQEHVDDWAPTPINTSFGSKEIGWQALGPAIACTALATAVVALRWYTRCRLARCVGLDDCVILFSVVSDHDARISSPNIT